MIFFQCIYAHYYRMQFEGLETAGYSKEMS